MDQKLFIWDNYGGKSIQKSSFQETYVAYTVLGIDLYNTFNEFNNPSFNHPSKVRSDIQDYLSEGKNNIQRLELDYVWSPGKNVFARVDIGYLEEMFGGFGGEVYYRPFESQLSLGFSSS